MMLDIIIRAASFMLIRLFIWFYQFLLRDSLTRFSRFAKSPMRIIQIAELTALKFCIREIPSSKNPARKIKRGEIKSAFSHYKHQVNKPDNSEDKIANIWIAALIKAGEFMGGGDTKYSDGEGDTPAEIGFSKVELTPGLGYVGPTCRIYIERNKTYWIYTDQNLLKRCMQGDVVKAEIHAIVEIPGLSEFIELLERVGLKKTEFYDILKSF